MYISSIVLVMSHFCIVFVFYCNFINLAFAHEYGIPTSNEDYLIIISRSDCTISNNIMHCISKRDRVLKPDIGKTEYLFEHTKLINVVIELPTNSEYIRDKIIATYSNKYYISVNHTVNRMYVELKPKSN